MRKIITTTFVTLDGVMQAPGRPDEDTTGGFKYGGWMFKYGDDTTDLIVDEFMKEPFEMLLGKHTYDIFAGFWPQITEGPIAQAFNSTKKYVISDVPADLAWEHSTLITGEVVPQIKKLKEADAPDLWVYGSSNLIQTLLKHHLIDRMYIWIFPITLGTGKRLFAEGTQPTSFKLVESKISSTGTIIATYEPAGDITFGSVG